jgi:hypothetical protein
VFFIVMGLVAGGIHLGTLPEEIPTGEASQVSQGQACYNRYCYEFQWTCCCVEPKDPFNYHELQNHIPSKISTLPTCPEGGDVKWCDVRVDSESYNLWDYTCLCNRQVPQEWFVGSGNCQRYTEGWWIWTRERWKCDTETMHTGDSQIQLEPGEKIYTWDNAYASVTGHVYRYALLDTGRAGSCVGEEVEGTVGCTYAKDYLYGYDEQGRVIAGSQKLDESRCIKTTAEGDKRVCGSTCDACADDLECASRYPQEYYWGNRVLGGICSGRTLQLFGCDVPQGTIPDRPCMVWQDLNDNKIHDPGEPCEEYQEKKECTLVKTVGTGIECCTDDDCWLSNQYCEWYEDFKSRCVEEKECTRDSDCGTLVECDSYRKEVTEPYCSSEGTCDTRTLDRVECCTDADCPLFQGQVQECVQYECVATSGKTRCPFGCCTDVERDQSYIGGDCPDGFQCCADDHICKEDCGSVQCDQDGKCEAGETSECSDCYTPGPGPNPDDPCGFECFPTDIGCLFDKHVVCPVTVAVTNALIWVGIIAVVLIVIYVIIKLAKGARRMNPMYYVPRMPPYGRRNG